LALEEESRLDAFLNMALVIVSIALIVIIIVQSRGAGLGGLGGGSDMGGGSGFYARRGIERLLFNITIGMSVVFFLLAILNVVLVG
jgi:preprotein translocase subunit SecG